MAISPEVFQKGASASTETGVLPVASWPNGKEITSEHLPIWTAQAHSYEQLSDAMRSGNEEDYDTAFFEAPSAENAAGFTLLDQVLDTSHPGYNPDIHKTLEGYFSDLREALPSWVGYNPKFRNRPEEQKATEIAAMEAAIDFMEADLTNLASQFEPEYVVSGCYPSTLSEAYEWHRDREDEPLNIVRTYLGESTQYKHFKLEDGAVSVHRGGSSGPLHRTPARKSGKPRFAMALRLIRTT